MANVLNSMNVKIRWEGEQKGIYGKRSEQYVKIKWEREQKGIKGKLSEQYVCKRKIGGRGSQKG